MIVVLQFACDRVNGIESIEYTLDNWVGPAPRVGERIEVFRGWASEEVKSVTHMSDGSLLVELRPDTTGEYAQELRALGLIK
jgi:hypothetical protein